MITIQELHLYKNLSERGLVPSLVCPIDSLHTEIFPWQDENENVLLWCVFCNSKVHLGEERIKYIKMLLHQ